MPPTVRLSSWLAEQPFDNSLLVDQRSKCLAARRERQPEQAAVVRAAAGMLPLEELEFGSDHGYVWPTQTAAAQATGTRTHALEPRLDEQPRGLGLHAQPVSAMGSQWLFDGCLASLQSMGVADVTHLQAAELAIRTWGLLISTRPGEQLQGEFLDLFGCDQLDFIGELLAGRSTLSTLSVPNKPQKLLKMLEKSRQRREASLTGGYDDGAVGFGGVQQFVRRKQEYHQLLPRGTTSSGQGGFGLDGLQLPPGTQRQDHKRWEEWLLPPTKSCPPAAPGELIEIASAMPSWAARALSPIKSLNRLQSKCFDAAFHTSDNLLVCAPTGSGKTNVAILAVLRALGKHTGHLDLMTQQHIRWSKEQLAGLKIVYLAPLKALAAEVARKFGKSLNPLGVQVRELTGDTTLSRAAINDTQILVATPEKWDVITRKTADVGLAMQVQLLIIDEVHLLHEDRGAVLEALVARTMRMALTAQKLIRIVALSATLPNYKDVARFLHVKQERGLFFFDAAFRPVPLSQEFIGVKEKDRWRQQHLMNEVCWQKVRRSVAAGHQCLVFVHARNDTVRTGQALLELAREASFDMSSRDECPDWDAVMRQISKSSNVEMKELFLAGLGIHHAGMLRPDRLLIEKLFERGLIKVLMATATLSWGVNLPAHTVVVKGTQIYSAEKGGFVEMSMQDVLQCFGRAGRPQFDSSGEGIIITSHDKVSHYLRLLHTGLPIESQLLSVVENHLNAEVVLGTLATVSEAVEWLGQTYLYTRAIQSPNPLEYGITIAQRAADPDLYRWREALATKIAKQLASNGMVLYAPKTGTLRPTALGRIASNFYIDCTTIEEFADANTGLKEYMEDAEIFALVGRSTEFANLKIRQEEFGEMDKLYKDYCRIEPLGGVEHVHGKVSVLLQAYLSNARIRDFALIIDQGYVVREAGRILRALFEIAFYCRAGSSDAAPFHGWIDTALSVLTICKALDRRTWHITGSSNVSAQHPLAQLLGRPSITPGLLALMQRPTTPSTDELRQTTPQQLTTFLKGGGAHSSRSVDVLTALENLPVVSVTTTYQPIARVPDPEGSNVPGTVVRINCTVRGTFKWSERLHGTSEPWIFFVQDDRNALRHYEQVIFSKGALSHSFSFHISLPPPPAPPVYFLYGNSEQWLGCQTVHELDFTNLQLPTIQRPHTDVVGLEPLSTLAIRKDWPQVDVACFEEFNAMQSQLVRPAYGSDESLLVAAASGNGKTTIAELAILRHFSKVEQSSAVLVLTMYSATASAAAADWRQRLGKGLIGNGMPTDVADLGPDIAKNAVAVNKAHIICSSAEHWDATAQRMSDASTNGSDCPASTRVGLLILQNIHLIGSHEAGAFMEASIARLQLARARAVGCPPLRVVALSESIANVDALATWLGVDLCSGCYSFKNGLRPRPIELVLKSFSDRSVTSRLQAMAKPLHRFLNSASEEETTIVFVQSRRQAWQTAAEIAAHRAADDRDPASYCNLGPEEIQKVASRLDHEQVRHAVMHGVGILHSAMRPSQRRLIELLFERNKLQILVATADMGFLATPSVKAPRVAIKGCEKYDVGLGRYVDYTHGQILQLLARASSASATAGKSTVMIMCHDLKKEYLRGFLYRPYPVESRLDRTMSALLLRELVDECIQCNTLRSALPLLSFTFFGHRLRENPDYYSYLGDANGEEQMVQLAIQELLHAGFVVWTSVDESAVLKPTITGQVASKWSLQPFPPSIPRALQIAKGAHKDCMTGDLIQLLIVLASAASDCLQVQVADNRFNALLLKRLPSQLRDAQLPWPLEHRATKAWLLLSSKLERVSVPSFEYIEDQKLVLAMVKGRLVPAMLMVLAASHADTVDATSLHNTLQDIANRL